MTMSRPREREGPTPRQSPDIVELSLHDRTILEHLARKYTSPYRDVIRAKIVLLAAKGLSNEAIAARLDTKRQIVTKWRHRFCVEGLAGLRERSRDPKRKARNVRRHQ